tara:strand:+ start:1839 stop:2072 length:234 start_codon:yes stop_codon:yes gene_type:complete
MTFNAWQIPQGGNMTNVQKLKNHISALRTKHRDLDEKIKVLQSEKVSDDIIKRQKQQKLQLKDEITKIQTDIENLDE